MCKKKVMTARKDITGIFMKEQHRHHMQGYSSIVKRTENQITISEVLSSC